MFIWKITKLFRAHLDSASLHLDLAARQIDSLTKVFVHASMTHTFINESAWLWIIKKSCNYSGRSKQQATGLRAASVGAKRVPLGLSTPVHCMHYRCWRSFCLWLMDLHSISVRAKRVPLGLSAVPPITKRKFSLLQTSLHSLIFHFADVLNCYKIIYFPHNCRLLRNKRAYFLFLQA